MRKSAVHLCEQVRTYGVENLTDANLLTFLLSSKGTAAERERAFKQIKELLAERGGLQGTLRAEIAEMLQKGCDEALALRLQALLELSRRLMRPPEERYRITCPADIARLVGPDMRYLDHEEMRVLVLDTKNGVVSNQILYRGTVNSSVLRAAEVFKPAITRTCPAIALCHNHPSGNANPSPEDITVTEQLVQAGKLLDIEIVDHLIIGNPNYISLKERLRW